MRDVRAVLSDPATTVDLLTPKAIARIIAQQGIMPEKTLAIMQVFGRAHRRPNDAERLDAITVTKLLHCALPGLDLNATLAGLASSKGTTADTMDAVLRPILSTWRAAALGIDADLGQRVEDGLLQVIVAIEQHGLANLALVEPLANAVTRDLAELDAKRCKARDMPITHWVSPAFLAILPVAYTGVSMLAHLAEIPDLQEKLRVRPELRPGYLREVERLMNAFRYGTRQIGPAGLDLGDAWLPPRSLVVLDFAAANRDPALWDDPDLCLLDRPRQPTATFSFGPLACVGGQLSRQFLGKLLDAVLDTARVSLPALGSRPDRRPTNWSIARGYAMCRLHISEL